MNIRQIIMWVEVIIAFLLLVFAGGLIPDLIVIILSLHVIYELLIKRRKDDKEEKNKF